jgi:hypothetical protein
MGYNYDKFVDCYLSTHPTIDDFEDWLDSQFPYQSPLDYITPVGYYKWKRELYLAYEAGKQSQQKELQNRITELEEIINGREELQRGGI